MAVNVSDEFECWRFSGRPCLIKVNLRFVCNYFWWIKMPSIYFNRVFFIWQGRNMENISPNRAQLFVRNEYTVFTMRGTVALLSPIQTFYVRRAQELQLSRCMRNRWDKVSQIHKNPIHYVFINNFSIVCAVLDNIEGSK